LARIIDPVAERGLIRTGTAALPADALPPGFNPAGSIVEKVAAVWLR
jgi:hypothetical protein